MLKVNSKGTRKTCTGIVLVLLSLSLENDKHSGWDGRVLTLYPLTLGRLFLKDAHEINLSIFENKAFFLRISIKGMLNAFLEDLIRFVLSHDLGALKELKIKFKEKAAQPKTPKRIKSKSKEDGMQQILGKRSIKT